MKDTMRDNSVKRKPTRAASSKNREPARQDSLSPERLQMTRNLSPHDAAMAAQSALQPRIHAPEPAHYKSYRAASPTDEVTTPVSTMRNYISKPTERRRFDYDPEDVELHGMSRTGGASQARNAPLVHQQEGRARTREQVAGKAKECLKSSLDAYAAVWKERKEHESDEHLALRAIRDYVQQRRERQRISSPTPSQKFHDAVPYVSKASGNVAWPSASGSTVPLHRAPTPPPFPGAFNQRKPTSPIPQAYVSGREREPSIFTARTGVTTWSRIQDAVMGHDRAHDAQSADPNRNSFAGAFFGKNKGKGKMKGKLARKVDLIVNTRNLSYSQSRPNPTAVHSIADSEHKHNSAFDFQALNNISTADADLQTDRAEPSRTWNPQQHVFDPDRESYLSADAQTRYRANTAASSIYSQPAHDHEPRFSPFPPPAIPGEYLNKAVATSGNESRPVSPLSVDAPISSFFTPKPAPASRAANRRAAGDWTDSFHGDSFSDMRERSVSPVSIEPAKARPTAPRYGGAVNQQYDQNSARERYQFRDSTASDESWAK